MIRRVRGVALITAVLITALVGMVAANLAWDSALDMRRSTVLMDQDQALQIALGAESWLQIVLHQDADDNATDHLGEIWAGELPVFPIEGGEVFGVIEDLQGRFNINNLVDVNGSVNQDALEQFERLLGALGLDPRIAGITADWIDPDQEAGYPNGAEDAIYTGFIPPYRTPNEPISSIGELAAIEGIDKVSLDILAPHIAAIPASSPTPVNVNTATAAVLQSLDSSITPSDVERLLADREPSGFADLNTVTTLAPEANISESTEFFQLKLVVRIDTVRITYFSVLMRDAQGTTIPILRSIGTS
ncbi:MAG: type II secretion system minor pseudopilin GspK [Woeseiaceae bacterium]|nr:type II secretion system minor pseudopilin GspK [Woeseiaceae bacterium]